MNRILLGSICGIIFGIIVVLIMIPLQFEGKRAAMTGAFINRFAIGSVTGAAVFSIPAWSRGLLFGLLFSLPDAIITKAYMYSAQLEVCSLAWRLVFGECKIVTNEDFGRKYSYYPGHAPLNVKYELCSMGKLNIAKAFLSNPINFKIYLQVELSVK